MDPNETLRQLRRAISDYGDTRGAGSGNATADDAADRMRDAARALDEWLARGGFPPVDWSWSS
jgi:hypothetical protein